MEKKEKSRYMIYISCEIMMAFQHACIDSKSSVSKAIENFIKEYLEKKEKKQ